MTPFAPAAVALICSRCRGELEPDDLRCPLCGLGCEAHAVSAEATARADVLRCDGCGAALAYSAEHRAPNCGFCGSTMHIEAPRDPIEQAELVLPFANTEAQARAALSAWLSSRGFFRPSDLASASTIADMKPLFWAGWLCDAQAIVSYTADSDADSRRSAWAPHAGQSAMRFERLVISGSRGLTLQETAHLISHYDLSHAQPASNVPPGWLVERFELQRSAARSMVVGAIHGTAAQNVVNHRLLPGSRFRNVKVGVLLQQLATHRMAFPAWVLAYRYRGKLFRAVVHGHDARVVLGTSPISIGKIVLVVALVLAALTVVAALGLLATAIAANT